MGSEECGSGLLAKLEIFRNEQIPFNPPAAHQCSTVTLFRVRVETQSSKKSPYCQIVVELPGWQISKIITGLLIGVKELGGN